MKYGLSPEVWDAAKVEILHILIGVARLETTITYSELSAQLTAITAHPGAYAFHALLREVCQAEEAAGRGMICALVVSKATGIPGAGFFKVMQKQGRDCTDPLRCWEAECQRLYQQWGVD